ncbi:MAG: peptidoglycan editing factor PgeF [Proteobacteria bacterium]|nr:peptidoglycan editing factor PgeF [Pseudomonadota bacterium]
MTTEDNSYFRSELLGSTSVKHAFLGRFDTPEELSATTTEIFGHPSEDVITIDQVHGNDVLLLEKPLKKASSYKKVEADAIITALFNVPIAIRSADCLPILLFDKKSCTIGAAHAGWRSTLAEVAKKTVEKMNKEFGSKPENILAAFGPFIGACCYTVEPYLVKRFDKAGLDISSFLISDSSTRLDLARANRDQLIDAGIKKENISTKAPCTSCNTDRFYSYREEGEKTGRELSIIMMGGNR